MELVLIISLACVLGAILAYGNDMEGIGHSTMVIFLICVLSYNYWYFKYDVRVERLPVYTGYVGDKPIVQFYIDSDTKEKTVIELYSDLTDSYMECRTPRPYSLQSKVCGRLENSLFVDKASDLDLDHSNSLSPVVYNWYKILSSN